MKCSPLKKISFFLLFLLLAFHSWAGIVKGKITSTKTNEPLAGATVVLTGGKKTRTTTVDLDGSYSFKNLPVGKYSLSIQFSGYKATEPIALEIKQENDVIVQSPSLDEQISDLDEVTIKGGSRETDQSVRKLEKNSDVIQNILSQKAIELSPDVTVAASLQRMSGVIMQGSGSTGEARYAIIRGMDQRYNTTLINGIKIPSPDDKYRYVPMDLFASDLLERLEVVKALTPNMEGDAIGGVMNLVMKNAPAKRTFHVFASGGASTLFNDRPFASFNQKEISKKDPSELYGPAPNFLATDSNFKRGNLNFKPLNNPINVQAGLTYGDRFFHKKLGVVVGLSFQNTYSGSNQIVNKVRYNPQVLSVNGTTVNNYPTIDEVIENEYSTQNRRIGINNKWDYRLNSQHKFSLFNMYVRLDQFQARYQTDTSLVTNPNVRDINYRSQWQIQDIYNSTLKGEHQITPAFKLEWIGAYSIAKQLVPDYAQFSFTQKTDKNVGFGNFLGGMDRVWQHNTDKDLSAYLNFQLNKKLLGRMMEFSWGGMFRHKDRDNYYHEYNISPKNSGKQLFTNIYDAEYSFKNSDQGDDGRGNFGTGRNYTITEEIGAGYVQLKFLATKHLQIIGGTRVENTNQHYNTNLPLEKNLVYGRIWYTDVLPSLHLKYVLNQKQQLRLAYYKSLVRPNYVELIPQIVSSTQTDAYDQQGNPAIKHTTADNLDLRYEVFPKANEQILLGAFLKKIDNPIEVSFSHYQSTGGSTSPNALYLTPTNFGTFTNYGLELAFSKYVGKFGFTGNYSFTQSSIVDTKSYYYRDTALGINTTKLVDQTRPMQGQAKHIANASLIYKHPKIGLELQLALVYTGERLAFVNLYENLDIWQKPVSRLDFSFQQKIMKGLVFFGKLNNITNTNTRFFIKQPYFNTLAKVPGQDDPANTIFIQRDTYKASYLFGFRYKL